MYQIDLIAAALHYSGLYLSLVMISGLFLAFGKIKGAKKRYYIFLVSTILFVLMAFRNRYMGNDTSNYIAMFSRVAAFDNPFDYIRGSYTEAGFLLYCWILSRMLNDARILFVVSAAFIMGSVGRFARKYVDNVGIFFCLLVGMMYFDFLLSGLRQSIAIAVLLFAFDYLVDRKTIPFIVLCLLAISFHNSAILFLLIYPLFSPKIVTKNRSLLSNILLFVAAFIGGFFVDKMLVLILRWFPKYNYYVGSVLFDGEPRLATFLKFLVFLLLLAIPHLVRKQPSNELSRYYAGRQMSMMNLVVMVFASGAAGLMRFANLFCMCALMHYCNEVGRMRSRRNDKVWMIMLTLLAFYVYGLVLVVLKTPEWQTTYPIQLSLWLN